MTRRPHEADIEAPQPHVELRRHSPPPAPRSWTYDEITPRASHLVKRFFRTIRRRRPSDRSRQWVDEALGPGERALFEEMAPFDQRHAIGVARLTYSLTSDALATRSALMHDVGKLDCRLSPVGRSIATVFAALFPTTMSAWCDIAWREVMATRDGRFVPSGWRMRFASYWLHPWTGRMMLESGGADPVVAAWSEHHHHHHVAQDLEVSWSVACAAWCADND